MNQANEVSQVKWISDGESHSSRSILFKSALAALFLELAFLTAIGWHKHWMVHVKNPPDNPLDHYVEAQIYDVPQPKLIENKPEKAAPTQPEKVLSRKSGVGKTSDAKTQLDEANQTVSGEKINPTHGPVVVFGPPPVIPSYLQDRAFKSHVVIDFYVSSLGIGIPKLVSSSGSEELDAIALEKVSEWKFRPAENDGKAIESKVRLRIVFEVN